MEKTQLQRQVKGPVVLVVLDGWGYRQDTKDNAIAASKKPFFDQLWNTYPHALLKASGLAVGLPEGQMGNSEVGHTTIGAGRALDTELVRISKAAERGEFGTNPAFVALFNHVKKYNSTLHVAGLVSSGGVHSHSEHLYAFLRAAKQAGLTKIAIHAFTDGRDTAPQSAANYMRELEKMVSEIGVGFIATICGRFFAMDRDNNWDRMKRAEDAIFECKGNVCKNILPSDMLEKLYKEKNALDEHLEPLVFTDSSDCTFPLQKNDAVFFFNFRADRARMLSKKILERKADFNLCFVTLTRYEDDFDVLVAFPPAKAETTLGAEVSAAGLKQAHIAETEKFAHATYFLNGGREKPYDGEEDILLPSRKDVPTHDLAPEMRADGITDKAIEQIEKGTDFIFMNYANPDMVGHTANVKAIVTAIETIDKNLARLCAAIEKANGVALITADHGNAEINVDQETGEKHTAHTVNPVPVILTSHGFTITDGSLADVAPTVLTLLGVPAPKIMEGHCITAPQA